MNRIGSVAFLSFAMVVIACGDDSCPEGGPVEGYSCAKPAVATCLARQPSIASGAYGCMIESAVGAHTLAGPVSKFSFEVYKDQEPPKPANVAPTAKATSDDVGFFEVALPAGSYWACTSKRPCLKLDVPENPPVRFNLNYTTGLSR
jgi:hypothetical protein